MQYMQIRQITDFHLHGLPTKQLARRRECALLRTRPGAAERRSIRKATGLQSNLAKKRSRRINSSQPSPPVHHLPLSKSGSQSTANGTQTRPPCILAMLGNADRAEHGKVGAGGQSKAYQSERAVAQTSNTETATLPVSGLLFVCFLRGSSSDVLRGNACWSQTDCLYCQILRRLLPRKLHAA